MSDLDAALRDLVRAEIDRTLRRERDRLARILHAHGLARVARDVEILDDEGTGPDACPACDGRRTVERHRNGETWDEPCAVCGESGHRQPVVTA